MTDSDRHDPFDALALPVEAQHPRPRFARDLRARLVAELGLDPTIPTVQLPGRTPMTTTTPTSQVPAAPAATTLTPYLAVTGGVEALAWYAEAFGAVEELRVVGDDGRLGHAELTIGTVRLMLSDEHPEFGVRGPATLGGSGVTLHLEVADVDALFARAVAAGATAQGEPADQSHGSRHGRLIDPYGHRWMLSQPIEQVDLSTYAEGSAGIGFNVEPATPATRAGTPGTVDSGGIWAGVFYRDALAGIRFLVDVFGFEEQLVVTGDDGTSVVHSELRWPEGGIVSAGTYDPANEFTQAPGDQALYVITADPHAVWQRCQEAGVEVVRAPDSPDYDPDGLTFSVRDLEGNLLTFGTYAGES
jgi:PhnB protein